MSSVYKINKGINKPIEFRGLRAQYIMYLVVGLVFLILTFAFLYICGASFFIILPLIIVLTVGLFYQVFYLNNKYGTHGLMKIIAKRSIPDYIKFKSSKVFHQLKKD